MDDMGYCCEYALGQPALKFLKERRLAIGLTFSKYLMQALDLDGGRVTVFLPPGLSLDRVHGDFEDGGVAFLPPGVSPDSLHRDFGSGGVIPLPPRSEWRYVTRQDGSRLFMAPGYQPGSNLIRIIREHLAANEEDLCIVEDVRSKAANRALQRRKSRIVVFRDEVYHLVQGRSLDADYVDTAIGEADTDFRVMGALTSLPLEKTILPAQREITQEHLRLMAERTVKIFTIAYDDMGYLIWHKGQT